MPILAKFEVRNFHLDRFCVAKTSVRASIRNFIMSEFRFWPTLKNIDFKFGLNLASFSNRTSYIWVTVQEDEMIIKMALETKL